MSLNNQWAVNKPLERLEDNLLQFTSSRQYEIHNVTFTDADTDVDVVHGLKVADPYKVRYQVLQSTAPLMLFHHPDSAWGPKVIKLRSSCGNTVVKVLLTVDESETDPLDRSQYPELKLQGDAGRVHLDTLHSDGGNAMDGISTGAGVRITDSVSLGGNNTTGSDWYLVAGLGTYPLLNFSDNARAYTPFQIRYDNVNGDYYVQPGNLTGAAVEVFLGRVDHATQGRWKGGAFLAGVATYGRTTYDGVWTTPAYSAGNFTAATGSWTVDSGDILSYSYMMVGKSMTVNVWIQNTDVSLATAELRIAIPGGFTAKGYARNPVITSDAGGAPQPGAFGVVPNDTYIRVYKDYSGSNWTPTTGDNTYVLGQITFEVN